MIEKDKNVAKLSYKLWILYFTILTDITTFLHDLKLQGKAIFLPDMYTDVISH